MTSRSCIYSSWFEAKWSSVQLLVVDNGLRSWSYYWGPNRWANLRFLVWKGQCPVLLYKLGWKQQLYVQGIGLYAQIFVRTNVFFATWFTLRKPSTPVRNAAHMRAFTGTFCFRGYLYASRETLCLWHSMIRSLHFIQICISILRHILTLFTHFTSHQFFSHI